MAHVVDPSLRRVVLEPDGGQVAAGPRPPSQRSASPTRARPLHDDDVDRRRRRARPGVRSTACGRPVPGVGAAATVGAAVGHDGHEVAVPALDEARGPRAVDVPDQDAHATRSRRCRRPGRPRGSRSTAASTAAAVHGCKARLTGDRAHRARQPAQAMSSDPAGRAGTIHGLQRCAGTTGAKPRPPASRRPRRGGRRPVLPQTTAAAPAEHARGGKVGAAGETTDMRPAGRRPRRGAASRSRGPRSRPRAQPFDDERPTTSAARSGRKAAGGHRSARVHDDVGARGRSTVHGGTRRRTATGRRHRPGADDPPAAHSDSACSTSWASSRYGWRTSSRIPG